MGHLQGGLVSTVADTYLFVRMIYNRGFTQHGTRLLQEETVQALELPRRLGSVKSWWMLGFNQELAGGNQLETVIASCLISLIFSRWDSSHIDTFADK